MPKATQLNARLDRMEVKPDAACEMLLENGVVYKCTQNEMLTAGSNAMRGNLNATSRAMLTCTAANDQCGKLPDLLRMIVNPNVERFEDLFNQLHEQPSKAGE